MICLKNRTFAVSQTTHQPEDEVRLMLWFAWKIVLLQYHKQQDGQNSHRQEGCDLLEKSYFCSITNNIVLRTMALNPVVICLKNRTFAVSQTTGRLLRVFHAELWFAWKIVLLQYHKQQTLSGDMVQFGCDLLEKSYFCSITNNTI